MSDSYDISYDTFLIEQHEYYLSLVSESGIPIWLLDYYDYLSSYYREVDNQDPHENEEEHNDLPF